MRALPVPQEGWRLLPSCTQPWKLRDTQWQSVPTLLPPPQSPPYTVPGRVQEGGDSGMEHGAGLAGGTSSWESNGGVDRARA